MPCASHAAAVRDRLNDFGPDTDVVMITFTNRKNLDSYLAQNDLPFDVVLDADRAAYRAFGLGRGTVRRMYGLRAARRYWELFRSEGRRFKRPTEDTLQLGGDFVVDRAGVLSYGFWGAGPDERPSVAELIAAVSKAG